MKFLRLVIALRTSFVRAFALANNPHVPTKLKLLGLAGALFIISPLNILGDIPLLGIVDDIALFGFLINWFVRAASRFETVTVTETSAYISPVR